MPGRKTYTWTRPDHHCKWCKARVVAHNIGTCVPGRRVLVVWVHAATNSIWCRPPGESTLVRTAKPDWSQQRKWSHA